MPPLFILPIILPMPIKNPEYGGRIILSETGFARFQDLCRNKSDVFIADQNRSIPLGEQQ